MRDSWSELPLSSVAMRVTAKNKNLIDNVFTVSAEHGLIEQEKFFNKRVASKNLLGYTVVQPGMLVYNKSYSSSAPFGVITRNHHDFSGVVSPLYIVFEPKEDKVLGNYLELATNSLLFFSSLQKFIKEGGRAHGGITVSLSDFFDCAIPIPSLTEQKRIVDVLSSVDVYIDALQQQVGTARAARKAVLHELLSTSGDGWSECGLGDIAEVLDRMRKPISGAEREKRIGDVPYYGATGQAGWIDKPIFDEELVLLGEDAIDFLNPDVHKAYLISGPSWVNNHAHVLRANREKVLSFFLMEALNAVDYSQFVAFGTRSKLTQGSMMGISVQVPPLVEQKRIVEIVSSMDEVIQSTEQAVVDAKNLRSGLLSDLLSGEHEIPASYDSLLGAA